MKAQKTAGPYAKTRWNRPRTASFLLLSCNALAQNPVPATDKAKVARIEKLVVVYSPADDGGSSPQLSLSSNQADVLSAAEAKGMEVVIINADNLAPAALATERKAALLKAIGSSVSDSRGTWVWVMTHGAPKGVDGGSPMANFAPGDEIDTTLALTRQQIPYSDIAKFLNANASVAGIYLDACFGFCKNLEASCHKGPGKCVISSAHRLEGTNFVAGNKVEAELSKLVESPTPIDTHLMSARFPQQSADGSSRPVLFVKSDRAGFHDASGKPVSLCHGFGEKHGRLFLPGRAYDPEVLLGKENVEAYRKDVSEEPLAIFSRSYNLFCTDGGKWQLQAPGGQMSCSGEFDRSISLDDCDNLPHYFRTTDASSAAQAFKTDAGRLTKECGVAKAALKKAETDGIDTSLVHQQGFCFRGCLDSTPAGACQESGLGHMCWPLGTNRSPSVFIAESDPVHSQDYIQAKNCCASPSQGGSGIWDAKSAQCLYVCIADDGHEVPTGTCFNPRIKGPIDSILLGSIAKNSSETAPQNTYVCGERESRPDRACCEKAGAYFSPSAGQCYLRDSVDETIRKMDLETQSHAP